MKDSVQECIEEDSEFIEMNHDEVKSLINLYEEFALDVALEEITYLRELLPKNTETTRRLVLMSMGILVGSGLSICESQNVSNMFDLKSSYTPQRWLRTMKKDHDFHKSSKIGKIGKKAFRTDPAVIGHAIIVLENLSNKKQGDGHFTVSDFKASIEHTIRNDPQFPKKGKYMCWNAARQLMYDVGWSRRGEKKLIFMMFSFIKRLKQ